MKRLFSLLTGLALAVRPEIALASEVGGGYEGIASVYFTFIGLILIFGAYDVMGPKPYRKKAMMVITPVIAIALYLMLPA